MAYELHIVRNNNAQAEEHLIPLEEWQSFCQRDPSLRLENEIVGVNPRTGATLVIGARNAAVWTSTLTHQQYLFDYRRGRISFVHSDEILVKAKAIAQSLKATIEGDEGEAY
jgi:hypothetical protein